MKRLLPDIVRAILSEGGALSELMPRFKASDEQMEYARRVSELLLKPEANVAEVGPATILLEAGTGIGKSLGYLVPLMAYSALSGRRVAVATFTLDLIHQLDQSAALARDALILSGLIDKDRLRDVTHAIRLGAQEFVSESRTGDLLSLTHWSDRERAELESLIEHARDGGGIFRNWAGSLPQGITPETIALTASCPAGDREAFDAHVEHAHRARLVICSHAALINQAIGKVNMVGGLCPRDGERQGVSPDALVIDEADRIPGMAEAIVGVHIPVRALQRALSLEGAPPRVLKSAENLGLMISKALDSERRLYLTDASNIQLRGMFLEAIKESIKVLETFTKKRPEDSEARLYVGQMKRLQSMLAGSKSTFELPFIECSPVRSYPSFGMASANPGSVLNSLWRFDRMPIQRLIVTSATLSMGTMPSLMTYGNRIGLFKSISQRIDPDLSGSLQPKRFGKLDLVFADPRVPSPYQGAIEDEEEGLKPNPKWLSYTAKMICAAKSEEGRTLVLCGSFREAEALKVELAKMRIVIIEQARGPEGRRQAQAAFVASDNGVWVSPSVWEGLDLPGKIKQLVICRIPYKSIDGGSSSAKVQVLTSQGRSEPEALRIVKAEAASDAFRKFTQGIGRAIRSSKDSATLWIADPRVAMPEALMDAYLDAGGTLNSRATNLFLSAIPLRFRTEEKLAAARVMFADQEAPSCIKDFA